MKGPPSDEPNLDDILARDFAELKVGEEKLVSETPVSKDDKKPEQAPLPNVYNQRIDAVEDRASFTVRPPQTKPEEQPPASTTLTKPTVLKTPSAQPGDDFDVEW